MAERIGGRGVLAVAALLLLLPGIGAIGLWAPDEPRAAAVAREMFSMDHGLSGWVVLHLNGEAYTQKPPLYYWLAGLVSLGPGELSEWSARLPSVLAGLASVALTFVLGLRLFGCGAGLPSALLGAALLLTTFKFAHLARRVQFDVLLTAFELAALLAFWRLDRGIGAATRNRLALHACLGLALLTKGPVGFLIPVLVMGAWLTVEGRPRDLRRVFSVAGLLLSLGPILLWLGAAMVLAPPSFFADAVGGGLLDRFFSGTSHARPFHYYLYQFPVEFLPWTLLWPAVFVAARRRIFVPGADPERRRAWRFLLIWVAANLVFFSLSAGKRGLYLLPCFPAVALLCADALAALLADRARPPRVLTAGAATLGLALVGLGVFSHGRELAGVVVPVSFGVALLLAPAGAAAAWVVCVRRRQPASVVAVAVACVWAVEAAVFGFLYPALDPARSMKPVAEAAVRGLAPGEPLALLGSRAMVGGLAYYAGRPVLWLDDAEEVPGYFAGGGSALVMKERKLESVRSHTAVTVRERLREGDRTLLIVGPALPRRAVSQPEVEVEAVR